MRAPCRQCGAIHDAYAACVRVKRDSTPSTELSFVGKVVSERYRVGELLGSGVTGMVFQAEHVAFARPCAIKIMRARLATPELVSRVFNGDAVAAWALPHPSLVEVFDIGALPDGAPFYVMERLDGETLQSRIARERLSLAAAIDMMMQLMSAVVALHARELLLRDLRPNNVFLVHRRGCRPLVKLLDVGLARLAPIEKLQDEWTTLGAMPGGYPHYLSPERARGEAFSDVASDLFVAGAIFYEALAGQRAFDGGSWRNIVDAVCLAEPRPLNERRGDVPAELAQFVARSMAQDPRKRPATAKEMQDQLRAIFEDARKQSTSIYAPAPVSRRSSSASIPVMSGPMAEPFKEYKDEETRRLQRAERPVDGAAASRVVMPTQNFEEEPHPAALEEMEQTLERLGSPRPAMPAPAAPPPAKKPASHDQDDETETTQMSPELKARIDQLMSPAGAPKSTRR